MMDLCLICLDSINENYIYPKYCNCKVKIHRDCMEKCQKNNIYCPICKVQIQEEINPIYNGTYVFTYFTPFSFLYYVYTIIYTISIIILSIIIILSTYGITSILLVSLEGTLFKFCVISITTCVSGKIILHMIS